MFFFMMTQKEKSDTRLEKKKIKRIDKWCVSFFFLRIFTVWNGNIDVINYHSLSMIPLIKVLNSNIIKVKGGNSIF